MNTERRSYSQLHVHSSYVKPWHLFCNKSWIIHLCK